MVQEGRNRISITLSAKVLKKLASVARKGEESQSRVVEAALIRFFASPGVLRELFGADSSFRDLRPSSVFELARAMGLDEHDAADLAFEQHEINQEEEIDEHLEGNE